LENFNSCGRQWPPWASRRDTTAYGRLLSNDFSTGLLDNIGTSFAFKDYPPVLFQKVSFGGLLRPWI